MDGWMDGGMKEGKVGKSQKNKKKKKLGEEAVCVCLCRKENEFQCGDVGIRSGRRPRKGSMVFIIRTLQIPMLNGQSCRGERRLDVCI